MFRRTGCRVAMRQERLLTVLDAHSRSGKKIGAILRAYAELVIASQPPQQSTLIPIPMTSKAELFEQAIKKGIESNESVRMFQSNLPTTLTELIEGFKKTDTQTVGRICGKTVSEINALGFDTGDSDVILTKDTFTYILTKHGQRLSNEEWGYLQEAISNPTEVLPNLGTEYAPHRAKSVLLVRGNRNYYLTIVEVTEGRGNNVLWNFWMLRTRNPDAYLKKFREVKKSRHHQPGGTAMTPHVPRNMADATAGKPESRFSGSQAEDAAPLEGRKGSLPPHYKEVKRFCAAHPHKEFCHV